MLLEINGRVFEHELFKSGSNILDGRLVSTLLLEQVKDAVGLLNKADIYPCLAVIQVGDDPASSVYVRNKIRACERVGIRSLSFKPSIDDGPKGLSQLLHELNERKDIHGILVQLPLPNGWRDDDAIANVSPEKDVDGFHPINLGCLASGRAVLEPCTPRGIMTLLRAVGVDCRGKRAVVVGRSVIVGRPIAQMLVRADATVTVCHRYTTDLAEEIARADIVVVATGVPELIKGSWIKPSSVVIDVGISRLASGKLIGDVEFEGAQQRAGWITPVPGGVGPMTVATLLENTVNAACLQNDLMIRGGRVHPLNESDVTRVRNLTLTYL